MKHMYYGRLIIQPFIFFLISSATYNMSIAKSSLCTQTSIIESVVEDISDHIGGCTLCDELSIIDSKIDALTLASCDLSVVESIVDNISDHIGGCTLCDELSIIDSKIDALTLASCDLSVVESIVDNISDHIGGCTLCDELSIIDSKIDALTLASCDLSVVESIVDNISDHIGGCTLCDQLSIIDSKIDALTLASCDLSVVESIVDNISDHIGGCTLCDELSIIDSKIDALTLASCDLSVVESIVDNISDHIGGCTLCDELSIIDSKIDALTLASCDLSVIESIVDNISDHIGGCTLCDELSIIDSKIDALTRASCDLSVVESIVDNISDHIGGCTLCDELSIIDSKIDALTRASCDLSVVESIVDNISNHIGGCTLCDELSIIDSKIDALTLASCDLSVVESIVDNISNHIGGCTLCDELSIIDSKIDALTLASCDLSVVESIVDNISDHIGGCTLCDELSIIDSKIDALDTDFSNVATQATVSVIESIVDNISDHIGGCTLCDELSIIDSKIDALTLASCDLSVVESIVDNISDHIGGCTLCDELSIIDSKIDALDQSANCCSTIDIINSTVDVIDSKIDTLLQPCGPTSISATFNITQPGNYCVANSFNGSITIQSSDVYLDLNNRTITNDDGNAIEVAGQLNQVVITNGYVMASDNGIQIDAACTTITISDIVAFNCGQQGIQIDAGCNTITISDIVTSACAQQGIQLNDVSCCKITGCDMISSVTGLQLNSCNKVQVTNCAAETNSQAGIELNSCTSCCVTGCKAIGNGAGTASIDTYGIVSDSGSCNIIENCIVVDTEIVGADNCSTCFVPYMDPLVVQDCTFSTTTAVVRGISLLNAEQNSKIIDCEVGCTQSGVSFIPCNRVLSPNSTQSFGIALDETQNGSSASLDFDLATSSTLFGATVTSVAWLVANENNYLAAGGNGPNYVQIFNFETNATTSLQQVATSTVPGNDVESVAWLACDGNNYLATGNNPGGGQGTLNIFEFDPTVDSLTSVTQQKVLSTIFSVAWLIANGNFYIAASGTQAAGSNRLAILKFNPALSSLTTVTLNPVFSGASSGNVVNSVAWLVSNGNNYLAVGGAPLTDTNTVKVFEFLPTTSSLSLVATSSSIMANGAGSVKSVAWLVCNNTNYLAIGGLDSDGITSTEATQILDFDTTTSTLTEVASFVGPVGDVTDSVAWLVCNSANYLATGNANDPTEVRIFEFDPNSTTSLLQVAVNSAIGDVQSVAWLVSEGQAYLATSGAAADELNIFDFGCNSQVLPTNNIIKNNLVYNTDGVGINGDSETNFIVGNVAYNNDQNYGSDVATEHIFSGGIAATLPNPFLNSSFPPL